MTFTANTHKAHPLKHPYFVKDLNIIIAFTELFLLKQPDTINLKPFSFLGLKINKPKSLSAYHSESNILSSAAGGTIIAL